jgi:hypothetical protein
MNINTQYAILESIYDRSTPSILIALKSIFKKLKIQSLESDEEAASIFETVFKYNDKMNIDYYVVTEQRHYNLGTIDRFKESSVIE